MDLEVGRGSELQTTLSTTVWLLFPMVHPTMGHQLTFLDETLITLSAGKWLLSYNKGEEKDIERESERSPSYTFQSASRILSS